MSKPFFSIITVSLNAEGIIKQTIESALNQSFSDFEIIVKDGLSTDNTLSELPSDSRIKVYSQKDCGIYDAMNQAVTLASGKYLYFLNCGDCFADDLILESVFLHIKEQSEESPFIVYGDYRRKELYCKQPNHISAFYLFRTPLNHQSMFFSEKVFSEIGNYDASMKIYADYDLTLSVFKKGCTFSHIDKVICQYMGDGVSENRKYREIKKKEHNEAIRRHYSNAERRKYNFYLLISMKKIRQKMASDDAPKWVRKCYRGIVNLINR